MPIHDYKCAKCKTQFEVFYTSPSKVETEEKLEKCPKCGSLKKKRLISKGTSHQFTGGKWFKEGY